MMNPHRRVGVAPVVDRTRADELQTTLFNLSNQNEEEEVVPQMDEHPPPSIHELAGSHRKLATWYEKTDLGRLNGIFAIFYTIYGAVLLCFTVALRPSNPLHEGQYVCYFGRCFAKGVTGSVTRPFHIHRGNDAFHPYSWSVCLAAMMITAYGGLIWSKLSIRVINMGHVLNWTTAFYTSLAAVQAVLHYNDPYFKNFTSPIWFEGMMHTVFGPISLIAVALLLICQVGLNIPTLIVHDIHYYPEMAQYSASDSLQTSSSDTLS
ncbi:unnamed protein product [Dicrocoelium dendriticum]|nr:unnamed protein product [Dicrocoelium dendriticum]